MNDDDLLSLWTDRVNSGRNFCYDETGKNWDTHQKFLLGEQWSKSDPDYNSLGYHAQSNITWQVFRTFIPALYMADPYIQVRAEPMPNIDIGAIMKHEKVLECLFNRDTRKMKLKNHARKALMDVLMYCYCCLKVGFVRDAKDTYEANTLPGKVPNNSAYIRRVSPRNVVIDPLADDMHDIRWSAETYVRPYLDVMDDSMIPKSIRDKIKPTSYSDEVASTGNPRTAAVGGAEPDEIQAAEGWVRFWEIMTLDNGGQILTAIENSGEHMDPKVGGVEFKLLIRKEPLPFPYLGRIPLFFFSFNEISDVLYGPSDLEMVMEPQREANYIRSLKMERIRGLKAVHPYPADALSEDEVKSIAQAPDGAFIPIKGDNANIFGTIQTPPINPDIYNAEIDARNTVWEQGGLDFASQNTPVKGETATAAMRRGNAMGIRMMDRSLVWKEYLEEVVTAYCKVSYHESDKAEKYNLWITDARGERAPATMSFGECVFGDTFQVTLETSNTFPATREVEISQFLNAVNLQANNRFVDQRELAIRTFELFRVRMIDKLVPSMALDPTFIEILQNFPQLTQQLMMIAQQEVQKMQQQVQGQGQDQRTMADPNAFQQSENIPNSGNQSAAMGGGGPNF